MAYYSCSLLVQDYQSIIGFYTAISSSLRDMNEFAVHVFWNVFFNWIDIGYEILTLWEDWGDRKWAGIGTNIAKILSDVFFKAPFTSSWTY